MAWLLVVGLVACWPGGLVAKCYVFGFGFGGLVAHSINKNIKINNVGFVGLVCLT